MGIHNITGAQLAALARFDYGTEPDGPHDCADLHRRLITTHIPQPGPHGRVERYPVNAQKDLSRPRLEVERHRLFAESGGGDIRLGTLSEYDSRVGFSGHYLGHCQAWVEMLPW